MVAAAAARRRQVVVKTCPEEPRLLADAADGRRALDLRRDTGHTLDGVARRFSAASAALLAAGLAIELWWDPGTHHRHLNGWAFCALGALPALYAYVAWRNRRLYVKLDEAANGSAAVAGEWN